jgi:hypothetical protein
MTIYHLRVLPNDGYFRNHQTLSCEILEIDETDKQIIEHITKVNGIEVDVKTIEKVMIDETYQSFHWSDEYFKSLEELKKYLLTEYILAYTSKTNFIMLVVGDSYNSTVSIYNFEDSLLSCLDNHVDLQKLLGLKHTLKEFSSH